MQYSDNPFFQALKSGKLLLCDSVEMMKEVFDYMTENEFPIGEVSKHDIETCPNNLFRRFPFIGCSRRGPHIVCFSRTTENRTEVIHYNDFLSLTGLAIDIDVNEMALLLWGD